MTQSSPYNSYQLQNRIREITVCFFYIAIIVIYFLSPEGPRCQTLASGWRGKGELGSLGTTSIRTRERLGGFLKYYDYEAA